MRTFDEIMASAMEELPNGIDTSEGSLLYNAVAKIAYELETAEAELDYIKDNMLVDTMDLEHLIRSGAEAGLTYKEATYATFKALITSSEDIEVGTRFSNVDYEYNYTVTENQGSGYYLLEAEDAGATPNNYLGDIEPIDYLESFESGELVEVVTLGVDDEDEDVYRQRRLDYFGIKPFGGNTAYYKQEVTALDEVGSMKIERRAAEETNILIHITDANYGVPTDIDVATVQTAIDPTDDDETGIAPIGHKVLIQPVEGVSINITATLTLNSGYIIEDLQSYIDKAVSDYLLELATAWDSEEYLVVRIAQIESAILDITGILDISGTTINASASNLSLGPYQIPEVGEITCN